MTNEELIAENNILKQHIELLNSNIKNVFNEFDKIIKERRLHDISLVDFCISMIGLENAMDKEYSITKEVNENITRKEIVSLYNDILRRLSKCEVDIMGLRGELD